MKLQRIPLIVISLATVSLLLGLYLMRSSPGAVARREAAARQASSVASSGPEQPLPAGSRLLIQAIAVESRPAATRAELSAVLGPVRRVTLAAEVAGKVIEVPVEEHAAVEAGEVIVQLERSLLEASANRADARRRRARADSELATLAFKRQQGLMERRATSAADFDRAQSEERARLADLREAEASLADAQVRLDKATIRAPFAGVVENLDLEPGAYLTPGLPVADVLDLSEIEIEVGVNDRQVVVLRQGDPVAVFVNVFPGETFGGVIAQLARAAHDDTQKYPVEVRVPNLDGRLLPGMQGRIRFDLGQQTPAIRIPRSASQKEFEIDYVFVVNGSGDVPTVERRRVVTRAVPFRPDLIEVVDGLDSGERIALTQIGQLRDGLAIREEGGG